VKYLGGRRKEDERCGVQTDLKNVVILEPLVDGDLLGNSDCVRKIFVGELVHLDGVV